MLAILDNHSKIYAIPGESNAFFRSVAWRTEAFRKWKETACALRKRRWAEKSPKHIKTIRAILQWFPDARVLLMLRDGRDVACSIKERCGDFEAGIGRWIGDNCAGYKFWTHRQVKVVKYEELVRNTGATLRELFCFLGERYEPQIVQVELKQRKWYSDHISRPASVAGKNQKQYRTWQINQPLFDGTGRWRKEMDEAAKRTFKEHAGEYLARFGYAETNDW